MESYQIALQEAPDSVWIYLRIAGILADPGYEDAAIDVYNEASEACDMLQERYGDDHHTMLTRAQALEALGKKEEVG